jgi:hypothetical protein
MVEKDTDAQRLTLELEFDVPWHYYLGEDAPRNYSGLIADIAPNTSELTGLIQKAISGDALLGPIDVEHVSVREGSILITIVASLHRTSDWVVWFGSLAAGIDYLRRIATAVCQRFLREKFGRYVVLVNSWSRWQGATPLGFGPSARPRRLRPPDAMAYLMACNAALFLLLAAVMVVLLIQR